MELFVRARIFVLILQKEGRMIIEEVTEVEGETGEEEEVEVEGNEEVEGITTVIVRHSCMHTHYNFFSCRRVWWTRPFRSRWRRL